jgi:hypothetical protein
MPADESNLSRNLTNFSERMAAIYAADGVGDRATTDRLRHVNALLAVEKLLSDCNLPQWGEKFSLLANALYDLEDGAVAPFLAYKLTGHPPPTTTQHVARACVATGIRALEQAGMSRKAAAKKALKDYPKLRSMVSGRAATAVGALVSWRDEFTQGKAKNEFARHSFSMGMTLVERLAKSTDPKRNHELARVAFNFALKITA